MKNASLTKGACAIAAAALAGAMVPAMALATDQTSTGGTSEVTSSGVEVTYDKDCSWTATYPTSVTMGTNADGSASADIEFNVKGLIDVDHQVTITPTSTSIELTGARHGGTLAATIAGPSSGAAATDVNSDAGATVKGSASATAEAVKAAAVDTYKGTTTFKIKCDKPAATKANVAVCSLEQSYITITSNNLTLNVGETWSDAIAGNSGKALTFTLSSGSETLTYTCKLVSDEGWVMLIDSDGDSCGTLLSADDPDNMPVMETSDTVPSTVYLLFISI